ncbi:nuclear transport factor 2 family protein [Frankia sp. AgB32]|uniref:nuclear transport factor 2 family protein n=1 Tax=Frankia sp. AgB32 TaxID=631119 RepID=UPI00200E485A|nr:nuclear transport factor 2 family protein [Frankia sp. AgB32]MCK9895453.1 nuclear transport factor 2 family protein [Frankia sp. AgB32]
MTVQGTGPAGDTVTIDGPVISAAAPTSGGAGALGARVARLEAERDIIRTFTRFFWLIDNRAYDSIATQCLTPDADLEFDLPAPHRLRGHDEFTGYLRTRVAPESEMVAHVPGLATVEWADSGQATLTAYTTAWHWFTARAQLGALRPADWTAVGLVDDVYQRHDGRWLIARRRVTPAAGLVAAGSPPPAGAPSR